MPRDERYFGFLASDVSRLLRTEFDRRVRAVGLTRSQWMVLTRLGRRPGCSQSELAEMMEVERATAGRLIDRLEDNGWVRREPDPQDRRVKRIYPTAEAERRQKVMWQIAEETVADALGDLTPEQQELVCDLLLSVKSRLQRMVHDSMPNGADIRANGDGRPVDAPRQSPARTS